MRQLGVRRTNVRRLISLLSVAALTSGALIVAAAPAQGANLGTITVTNSGASYNYSPMTLTGQVGDEFTVVNGTAGDTLSVTFSVGAGDTGEISVGASSCSLGVPACDIATTSSTTYTILKLGTVSLTAQPGGPIG